MAASVDEQWPDKQSLEPFRDFKCYTDFDFLTLPRVKSEALNPKSETNSNARRFKTLRFCDWDFDHLWLFRALVFDIRIYVFS